ncbi:MAG: hypothetical protein QOE06_3693, partial [Thermoleophilaceae bacterium]|nr:hypothetical protein [Thermoleophilaceae bacterium]
MAVGKQITSNRSTALTLNVPDRHDTLAQCLLLQTEDPTQFRTFCQKLYHEHIPVTTWEAEFVDTMIAARWRLLRTLQYAPPGRMPEGMHHYQNRMLRMFRAAVRNLRELRTLNRRTLKTTPALVRPNKRTGQLVSPVSNHQENNIHDANPIPARNSNHFNESHNKIGFAPLTRTQCEPNFRPSPPSQ